MIKLIQGKEEVINEAMLTKKYVGPAECASCDKNIVNLNGLRAEQVHWNKLPFREPAERLAKVSSCVTRIINLSFSMVKVLVGSFKLRVMSNKCSSNN
jgi:hypothetical protein